MFLHRLGERDGPASGSAIDGQNASGSVRGVWVEDEVLLVAQRLAQAHLGTRTPKILELTC